MLPTVNITGLSVRQGRRTCLSVGIGVQCEQVLLHYSVYSTFCRRCDLQYICPDHIYDRATSASTVNELHPYREELSPAQCTRHLQWHNSLRQVPAKKKQMFHFDLDKASSHPLEGMNATAQLRTTALALLQLNGQLHFALHYWQFNLIDKASWLWYDKEN